MRYNQNMKRVNLLPNLITAFGLSCGMFVCFKAQMTGVSTYVFLHRMTLILMLAGFADLIDGALARAMGAESKFGFLFDSMADAVSFGIAPSIVILHSLEVEVGSPFMVYVMLGSMLYSMAGILRLVRYNVIEDAPKKSVKPSTSSDTSRVFVGLPIPAAAAAVISPTLFLSSPLFARYFELFYGVKELMFPTIMIFVGYLMVSRLRFPSLKSVHFKLHSVQLLFLATIVTILVIYGIIYSLSLLLIVFSWGYILVGILLSIIRKIKGRKSKVLKDFEIPDHEDDESI